MTLADRDIKRALQEREIRITPQIDDETQLDTCAVYLRLGRAFRVQTHNPDMRYIDPHDVLAVGDLGDRWTLVTIKGDDPFILHPDEFVLGTTIETITLPPEIKGQLEGRSSLGRLGLTVHITAGMIKPGWSGQPTLELKNLGIMPLALYPGDKICSIEFTRLSCTPARPYAKMPGKQYMNQKGPTTSRILSEAPPAQPVVYTTPTPTAATVQTAASFTIKPVSAPSPQKGKK